MNKVDLSILVPCYNEGKALDSLISRLSEAAGSINETVEIIFIDDGSRDSTVEILKNLPQGFQAISHSRNRGYGSALKTGLKAASGEWVAIMDADGTYQPEELSKLWEKRDNSEMVVGQRSKNIGFMRRIPKWILTKLATILSGTSIPDLNSGFRIFRHETAKKFINLYPDGFSFTTTITLAFLCDGFPVNYEPINYQKRTGHSKIHPIADTYNFFILILKIILYFNPLKILLPASISLIVFGTIILFWSWRAGQIMDITVTVIYMLALQIAVLGLLADLLIKRSRPD